MRRRRRGAIPRRDPPYALVIASPRLTRFVLSISARGFERNFHSVRSKIGSGRGGRLGVLAALSVVRARRRLGAEPYSRLGRIRAGTRWAPPPPVVRGGGSRQTHSYTLVHLLGGRTRTRPGLARRRCAPSRSVRLDVKWTFWRPATLTGRQTDAQAGRRPTDSRTDRRTSSKLVWFGLISDS